MIDRAVSPSAAAPVPELPNAELEETTIVDLRRRLDAGELTSVELVAAYQARIDAAERGPLDLGSIIAVNPAAGEAAAALDAERAAGRVRGPLHGIPVLVKDNIDTDPDLDGGLTTTAGSLALADSLPGGDAGVTARLRAAGAIVLAKANLSEWANFRSTSSVSGWSAMGGSGRNPYVLDRTPCGSSSGSGTAVAANLAPVALGTETNGSIVCPSSVNGLVGIKPTVGLTSRAGVVPISHSQDTVGPMARTVADAAAVLSAIVGVDERDPATADAIERAALDYTAFVDTGGLAGARLGVARQFESNRVTRPLFDDVLHRLVEIGVELVDVEFPGWDELGETRPDRDVLLCELRTDLAAYLATRRGGGPGTLDELIRFNLDHAADELRWFGQELFELAAERNGVDDPGYETARVAARRLGRQDGLDAVLDASDHDGGPLDAVIAPTLGPAWAVDVVNGDVGGSGSSAGIAAIAGYPLVTVPMGLVAGLPVGLTFMGRAWSEPTLIRLAAGFEATFAARRPPRFLPTIDRR
ncbi:MAG: amidase [Actinomycetota bacterium]